MTLPCSLLGLLVIFDQRQRATMDILRQELTDGLPNQGRLLCVLLRLFAAIPLGELIGLQRVNAKKPVPSRS